jgi:Fe-S-cluster containining protein
VRDGPFRVALKTLVRWILGAELLLRRGLRRPPWRLAGTCGACARCCERPTIQTGLPTARLPTLRRLFLAWQRRVNGFEIVSVDRPNRLFTFRCTHFDPATRRCDSYASRPMMCRDYPRALLDQPWPEFFGECGFRPVARDAERRLEELSRSGLAADAQDELARRLRWR